MRIYNNNQQLAEELVGLFLGELPQLQKTINNAHQANDFQLLIDTSHQLHGSSSYCGAHHLKSVASALEEEAAKQQATNRLHQLVIALNNEIKNILTTTNC